MKVDFKTLDSYQARRGEFRILDVPPRQYVMVDGHGDPNTSEFSDALSALYPIAYGLKFASKASTGQDYVVPPLEGLWWAEDERSFTWQRDKSTWSWTLMILAPDWITSELFAAAREKAAAKAEAEGALAGLDRARLETLDEGRCVQTLHLGSFDEEGPTLARMHRDVVPGHGLALRGKHHEIYLSDFRRVEPAKLRTILRQPVEPSEPSEPSGPSGPSEPVTSSAPE